MKSIERNIANHLFEMRYEPDRTNPGETGAPRCCDPSFKLDGVHVSPKDFDLALRLLTAEARK